MDKSNSVNSVFSRRLKEARLSAGYTQAELGVLCGLAVEVSSARINQYERGVHEPKSSFVARLAEVLELSPGYFYESRDELADLFVLLSRLDKVQLREVDSFISLMDSR